jgi:hypothetical protein
MALKGTSAINNVRSWRGFERTPVDRCAMSPNEPMADIGYSDLLRSQQLTGMLRGDACHFPDTRISVIFLRPEFSETYPLKKLGSPGPVLIAPTMIGEQLQEQSRRRAYVLTQSR